MRGLVYLGGLIFIVLAGVSVLSSQIVGTPQSAVADAVPKIAATSNLPYVPTDQGAVKGSVPYFQLGGRDLRASVLAQPLPLVWLESSAQGRPGGWEAENAGAVRIDLPDGATTPLMSCWEAYLAYYFRIKIESEKEPRTYVDQDVAMVITAARTAASLEKLSIDAPHGRRRISHAEALGIISFLGRSAEEVVEQAGRYNSRR
jgi:hypothetical protein